VIFIETFGEEKELELLGLTRRWKLRRLRKRILC
jgi:hypothetical protein